MAEKLMTFTEHLEELRTRLKYALFALLGGVLLAYGFSDLLFVWLTQPLIKAWSDAGLGAPQLHFSNPIEPFFTYLKVALVGGLFISSPVAFYQLWLFVAPGLYKREKRYVIPFTVASVVCFAGGASFGYFMVFPYGFQFFLSFAQADMGHMQQVLGGAVKISMAHSFELRPTLMMGEYFGLVWRLLLAFGLIFELPLVLLFLSLAGVVDYKALWRFNRYFIIIAFVIGAVLTPPDVITQVMMAAPLLVLYNLSILLAWLVAKVRAGKGSAPAGAGADPQGGGSGVAVPDEAEEPGEDDPQPH